MIEIEKLTALLGQRFDPDAASELDAAIGLNWGTAELRVAVQDRVLSIFSSTPYAANAPSAECVIYFANFEVAYALLIGSANPIEAFMRGDLRSDGYLLWVFRVLGAFTKPRPG